MDAEQGRTLLRKLPHTEETMQWGANLVYWVGDKTIGGKMFALINLDEDRNPDKPAPVLSFYVGPERYGELLEVEGVIPAPYMARIFWIALTHWNVFRPAELKSLLQDANTGVAVRLPARVRAILEMPKPERDRVIEVRKVLLEQRAAAAPGKTVGRAKKKQVAKSAQKKKKKLSL